MGNLQTGCCEFRRREDLQPRESTGEGPERLSHRKQKDSDTAATREDSAKRKTIPTRGLSEEAPLDTIDECPSSDFTSPDLLSPVNSTQENYRHGEESSGRLPLVPQLNLKKAIELNAKKMEKKGTMETKVSSSDHEIDSFVGDGLTDSDIDEDSCLRALDSPCFSARDTDRVSKDLDILRDFSFHNVETLIKLLDSNAPVQITIPLHPWAKSPTCMGALACIHLLLMGNKLEAEGAQGQQEEFIDALKRCRIIDKIINFLESGQRDKEDAALTLLNLITNSGTMKIPKDMISQLMRLMKSSPHTSKLVTIASIIDELSHSSDYWKQRVIDEGCVQIILEQFEQIDANDVELVLIFLTDLIMDTNGSAVQDRINLLKVLGLDEILQEMIEGGIHEEETIEEAKNLRSLLKPTRRWSKQLT